MYIIVGLGNPGRKYANTRHNLGYITVDRFAEKHNIKIEKSKFKSLVGEGIVAGQKVLLVKPETYMNNSGEAVRDVMDFYKVDTENLIVIYDDIDLPTGTVRIRKSGSAGTHNGMRSVVYQLNDDSFPRIRIGIGRDERIDLINYVTGGFTKEEVAPLEAAVDTAVSAIVSYLEEGIDIAMNKYNKKNNKEDSEKESEAKSKEDGE